MWRMTENAKRLRTWCESAGGMARILDEVLAERASAARAEVLEEVCKGLAKQADVAANDDEADILNATHDWVYGLIPTPATASIPAADELSALRRDHDTLVDQRDRNLREAQRYRELYEGVLAGAVSATETMRDTISASIPMERVRGLFRNIDWDDNGDVATLSAALAIGREELNTFRLGVPIDAAQETTCPACGHPPHTERCVRAVSPTHSRGGAVAARACGCEATPDIACLVFGSTGPHKMSCRATERAAAVAKATMTPTLLDAPMPRQCGGCAHRIHAPDHCGGVDGICECRWTP